MDDKVVLPTLNTRHAGVAYQILSKFEKWLSQGRVPVKTLRRGSIVDKTLSKRRAATEVYKALKNEKNPPINSLLSPAPNGDVSDGNRFNGLPNDGSSGAFAYYAGLVINEFGVSPGHVVETRHYNPEQINWAEIKPGDYVESSLIGQRNPAYAFIENIVIRTEVKSDIKLVNFNFNEKEVQQFNDAFSVEIKDELDQLPYKTFQEALLSEDESEYQQGKTVKDYSVARPIGNLILKTEGLAGLCVSSARTSELKDPSSSWADKAINVVFKAEKGAANEYLDFWAIYIVFEENMKIHIKKKNEAESVDYLKQEGDKLFSNA